MNKKLKKKQKKRKMTLLKKTKIPAKKLPTLQLHPKQTRPWRLRTKKRKETAQLKNPTSGKGNVDTQTTNLLPVQIQNLRNLLQVYKQGFV